MNEDRLPPEVRYQRDSEFANLVDLLTSFIEKTQYIPTDLREAVMLAAIRRESPHSRGIYGYPKDI